jgi:chitinase
MPLYGRAFKMTTPGCTGPMCTYVGKESAAAPGRCTNTRGYISNFEIREIIANKVNVQQLKTAEGDELVIYDGTEYVGWMSKQKYQERTDWIKGLNFAGTSDWAIDLDGDYDVGGGPG